MERLQRCSNNNNTQLYQDSIDFLKKAKKTLRDKTRSYYIIYGRDNTSLEDAVEQILQSSLRKLWPLERQTKISLQQYMDEIQEAFGCTFKKVKSAEWMQRYKFQIDGQKWTLSQGGNLPNDWRSEYLITLNDYLSVGSPKELVQVIQFFNVLLPEFRSYVTDYAQKGRFFNAKRSKVSEEDRIIHDLPLTNKAALDLTKPYPSMTVELLCRKVQEYNVLYFEGMLPPCSVKLSGGLISRKRNPCYAYYGTGKDTIVVDFYVTYCSSGRIRALLLHEMIHHYMYHFYRHEFKKETSHGATFQRIRRKLNEKYGLRIDQKMTAAQKYYRISSVEIAH